MDALHGAGGKNYEGLKGSALEACADIERLTTERRAGRQIGLTDLDPLEFELMCVWESREREYELLFRSDFSDLIAALKAKAGA